jgi:hypothetical protein
MNRILTVLTIVLIASMVTSCATMQPNKKKLIGTWKIVKFERYNIPNLPAQTTSTAQKAKTAPGDTASATLDASKMEEQLARLIKIEGSSTLTINANKTAVKEFRGKTSHAKWKLKNKGTRLLVDFKESGEKLTIDILHINDTSIVAFSNLPIGGFKVTYKKQKTEAATENSKENTKKK